MYLSFNEYKAFGGELNNAEFNRFAYRAEREIDNATLDRCKSLTVIPECVKRCVFELVTFFSENAKSGTVATMTGFSNDGYSVTYAEQKSSQEQIADIIHTYLAEDDNNLLYCGVE